MNENIYTPEKWERVLKRNKMILEDYKKEMLARRLSARTIEQYLYDIRMFFCWAVEGIDEQYLLKMTRRDFRDFFLAMEERQVSAARINRLQSSIRNLLNFCFDDDERYSEYNSNPMLKIRGVSKNPVKEIIFLENDRIEKTIDLMIKRGDYLKALYLSLSYESAGRRAEIHQVKSKDISTLGKTGRVTGKRGKTFQLRFFSKTMKIFELLPEEKGEYLFSIRGEQVSYGTLYDWTLKIRRYYEEISGEYLEFNPHSFRHSSLENYENGTHYALKELGLDRLPIKILKVLANHDNISTTESYLQNKEVEEFEKIFGGQN